MEAERDRLRNRLVPFREAASGERQSSCRRALMDLRPLPSEATETQLRRLARRSLDGKGWKGKAKGKQREPSRLSFIHSVSEQLSSR